MAVVRFHDDLPAGFRLAYVFTSPVAAVAYARVGTLQSAAFDIRVGSDTLEALYRGPSIGPDAGGVTQIAFERAGLPWITFGSSSDRAPHFSYTGGLAAFQGGGGAAAVLVMAGDDRILGSSNDDILEGFGGDDRMDGGPGADTLIGGAGDDSYWIASADDRVVEEKRNGYDTVFAGTSYKIEDGDEVERLEAAAGRASINLTGNAFANLIIGNLGANVMNGRGGADRLEGLSGDDVYIVEDERVRIVEEPGRGFDTIQSSVDFVVRNGVSVEALAASGTRPVALTGNDLSNRLIGNIGGNALRGLSGNDELFGDGGHDRLSGGAGNDRLYGGAGSDVLSGDDANDMLYGDVGHDVMNGGSGADVLYAGIGDDVMHGGTGDDRLYGDAGRDGLYGDDGDDTLYGGVGDNRLLGGAGDDILHGGANKDAIQGGEGADALFGFDGNDRLSGGTGKDTLATGEGHDTIAFDTAPSGPADRDVVTDFNRWTDRIEFSRAAFAGLPGRGALSADAFHSGAAAADASDRVIYDPVSGVLSFDPDGNGPAAQVALANLGRLALDHTAFWVV